MRGDDRSDVWRQAEATPEHVDLKSARVFAIWIAADAPGKFV
jgi:hypothetical protein